MKAGLRREPNGRYSRAQQRESPPTVLRRIKDAAIRRHSDARWGEPIGWLFLEDGITAVQYAAAQEWIKLLARYRSAIDAPAGHHSLDLQACHSEAPDPDSLLGRVVSRSDRTAIRRMERAHSALLSAGRAAEQSVRLVCEHLVYPEFAEHRPLCAGLDALARNFGLTGRRRDVK